MTRNLGDRLRSFASRRIRSWTRGAVRDLDLAKERLAAEQSASFLIENAPLATGRATRSDLLSAGMSAVSLDGLICEFGVYRAETINHIASLTDATVHGFDSFEGLPEDWRGGFERGAFRCDGLPPVRPNVTLHKGLFHDSLPKFLANHHENVAFMHIDCDLYSSTCVLFELLRDRIVPGTVIQFDELLNYPGWQQGEFKAFNEFCHANNVEVEWIGYVTRDEQVLLRIRAIGDRSTASPPFEAQTEEQIIELHAL
jgi:hypothetical protein